MEPVCPCRSASRCFSMACWACAMATENALDEPRNNPVELLLQGLEFGRSLRRKSLVGEFDQAIDLPQIAFGFLAIEASDEECDHGAGHAQNHAAQIEILLELIEEALLSTIEIGGDARMNRQDWVLVVGVGRFDLTGSFMGPTTSTTSPGPIGPTRGK